MPNAAGSATLEADATYQMGSVDPFRMDKVYPRVSPDSLRRIQVSFNRKLPAVLGEDTVRVSPAPGNVALAVDGKSLFIDGDFSEHDSYVVTLAKGFEPEDGMGLSNPGNVQADFERLAAEISLPSHDEAQLAHGLRKYAINTVNISSVQIRIKKLAGKGAARAFQGYRNYTGDGPGHSLVEPTSVIPFALVSGETTLEKEIQLGAAVDTGKTIEIAWDELLPAGLDFATLFVDVIGTPHPDAGAEGRRNAQSIIQLTDIGLAWKFTESSSLVFAFSCQTGETVAGGETRPMR